VNSPNYSAKQNALRAEIHRRTEAKKSGLTRWIPHTPTDKQQLFLDCRRREAFYGGAAGGGKTDALLMAALAHVDVPGYAALLFRRTFADLNLPGALMDRAHDWLGATSARWNAHDHVWSFPSGATLSFGYLETERDRYRYQSSELQFIGFDELTEFAERDYLYLFSRLRRKCESEVPLRMRSASNPGGLGHEWVRARFIDAHDDEQRIFIPARLDDNPHLNRDEYAENLSRLDAVTRAQLLEGDWQVRPEGVLFHRDWFAIVEQGPEKATRVRYWDKAATEGGGARTAGVLIAKTAQKQFFIENVVCGQWSALQRERIMRETAERDGPKVKIYLEQEPGSGGKESAEASVRNLAGFTVHADRVTGSKVERARPLAAQCEAGNVRIVHGSWNHDYLEELCSFPLGSFCDRVDASSGAFNKLAGGGWSLEQIAAFGRGESTLEEPGSSPPPEEPEPQAEPTGSHDPTDTAEERRRAYEKEVAERQELDLLRARGFR
jgi:predicted phage terminase large subunit-like protein